MSPIDLAFAILKDIGEIFREGEIPRSQVVEDPQTPAQNLWSSMAQDWREHLADTEQCCRRAKKEYMDAIAGTHIDQWDDIAIGEQWSNEGRGRASRPLPSDIESMDCAEFESMIQNQLSSLDGSENAGPYHFSRPKGRAIPYFPDATHPDEGQVSLHEALRQVLYIWKDCEERHNELIQENISDESGDFQASEPMHIDLAFTILKRQTTLGEWDEDFPSYHGPVTGYRALSDEQWRKIANEGLTGTPINTHLKGIGQIRDNAPEKGIYAWMANQPEGLEMAQNQAEKWAEHQNISEIPSRVVGIRGRHDLSYPDEYGNDWYGTWLEDSPYSAYILPDDIDPEQIVWGKQP